MCRVKANPPPKASSVYWRRVIDETPMAEITSSTISGNLDVASGFSQGLKRNDKPSLIGLRCNQVSGMNTST